MPDRALLRLLVCASLVDLAMNMPLTIIPLRMLEDGYAAQQAATAMFVPLVVALITTLPSGFAVDRFGVHKTLLAGIGTMGAVTALLLAAHSPKSVAALLAVRSACGVLYMTASFVFAASSDDEKQRLYGVTWLAMAVTISFSVGPALSTFLWQHAIHDVQFIACALCCAAALAFVPAGGAPSRRPADASESRIHSMPYAAWAAPLCFCVAVSAIAGVNNTLAVVGLHARSLSGGLFFSGTAVGMLLARVPSAVVVHRYGAIAAASALTCIMLAGGTIVALSQSNAVLVGGAILMGAAWTSMLPACSSLLLAAAPPHARGRAMAAYTFAMSLGAVIGGAGAAQLSRFPNGYAVALELACALPPIALAFLVFSQRVALARNA